MSARAPTRSVSVSHPTLGRRNGQRPTALRAAGIESHRNRAPPRALDVANELAYRSGDAKLGFVDSSRESFRYREIAVLASVLRRRTPLVLAVRRRPRRVIPNTQCPVLGVNRPS